MNISQMMRSLLGETTAGEGRTMELKVGQVVRGVVMQVLDHNEGIVQVNGVQVRARLDSPMQAGQAALLQVQPQSTAGQIVLKQVEQGSASLPDESLKQWAKTLGLPEQKWALELVRELRREGIPLGRETAAALKAAAAAMPPGANAEQWMRAAVAGLKRGLPITGATVGALQQVMFGRPAHELIAVLQEQAASFGGSGEALDGDGAHGGSKAGGAAAAAAQQAAAKLAAVLAQGAALLQGATGDGSELRPAGGSASGAVGLAGSAAGQAGAAGSGAGAGSAGATAGSTAGLAGTTGAVAGSAAGVSGTSGAAAVAAGSAMGPGAGLAGASVAANGSGAGLAGASVAALGPGAGSGAGAGIGVSTGSGAGGTIALGLGAGSSASAGTGAGNGMGNGAGVGVPGGTGTSAPSAHAGALQAPPGMAPGAAAPGAPSPNWLGQFIKWLGVDHEHQLARSLVSSSASSGQPPAQQGQPPAAQSPLPAASLAGPPQASPGGAAGAAPPPAGQPQPPLSAAHAAAGLGQAALLTEQPALQERIAGSAAAMLPSAGAAAADGQPPLTQESLKSALLSLVAADGLPASIKEPAQQLLQQITGQQLLLTPERGGALFSHVTMFIPLNGPDGSQTASVHIQTSRGRKGELDADNCRLLFDLQMKTLGTTLVDVHVVDKIVSLNLWNNHPLLGELTESSRQEVSEALGRAGYQLLSLRTTVIPDSSAQVEVPLDKSAKPQLPPDLTEFASNRYRGVDLKA
ncbi:hypothetical protein ACFO9Q_01270 [Paenibacillus sp. GCM10023252]|uniref:hypothetical protein n=1 Tax=Paenibacillus sp. GCM10023252 TaxID=3252649 RepID=UPI00361D29A4